MATKKKMLMSAAGSAGGAGLDIDEVFSTYLYEGNGTSQTITNGIDLDGEGGLVWIKERPNPTPHQLFSTETGMSGAGSRLRTDDNGTFGNSTRYISSFNSNGFSIGDENDVNRGTGAGYASWTFRKAPKFFDVVTWTGDGTDGRKISHSLDATVGSIFIKKTNSTSDWSVYHRASSSFPQEFLLRLNTTDSLFQSFNVGFTQPTTSEFTVYNSTTGADTFASNTSGHTYIAYLFSHNDGDGEFGPDGDQDIIKCGSYTGNGSGDGPEIDLGFEPQWLLIRHTDNAPDDWYILDTMRGINDAGGNTSEASWDPYLMPNRSFEEKTGAIIEGAKVTPTGFKLEAAGGGLNASGKNYIYIAIRRGPLAQPESATEVFDVEVGDNSGPPEFTSGFPVDFALNKNKSASSNWNASARLTGATFLKTNTTDAEASGSSFKFDYQDGYFDNTLGSNNVSWMWRRAPGYFDALTYTGNSTAGRTVSHNLGVAPEMMWIKSRNNARGWRVYHSSFTNGSVSLNSAASKDTSTNYFSTPTADNIILGSDNDTNRTAYTYIAYLFASLPGVSKVGSYTGTGAALNIDCGFTSGARFVLIKRTDSTGEWRVFDTARGIVAGNDPLLNLNSTNPEEAFDDLIDPYSAGFSLTSGPMVNTSGGSYIFYAIA